MILYALLARDPKTGIETVTGFRKSETIYTADDVRSFPDGRLTVRPVERIIPVHDQDTEKLEGQTYQILADKVIARDLVVPDRDKINRLSVEKQVAEQAGVIDALIDMVDMLVARAVRRGGKVGDGVFATTTLRALTAYRDSKVAGKPDPRAVGTPPAGWPDYVLPPLTPAEQEAIREILVRPRP